MPKLRITATHDGYRRAGRPWSRTPTDVEADTFSEDELKALRADPRITVLALADTDKAKPAPKVKRQRLAAIKDAIRRLTDMDPEKTKEGVWRTNGRPEVKALEVVLGWDLTAQERDEAWAALEEAGEQ